MKIARILETMFAYIIYALVDPDTLDIKYIGKATNVKKRYKAHLNENGDTKKCRWISKLRANGKFPIIILLENVGGVVDWQSAESFWINYYKKLGCDLCNHTSGGEGLHDPSPETREKLRQIQKSRCPEDVLAINRDPERRRRISEALSGKPKSKEHIAKLKQNQPGRKLSQEQKDKISSALFGNQYAKGSKRTLEQIEKAKRASTGRKYPNRKPMSLDSNLKRSNTQKGKPKSESWKEKIRQGSLRRWRNPDQRKMQSDRIKNWHLLRSENQSPKGDEYEVR